VHTKFDIYVFIARFDEAYITRMVWFNVLYMLLYRVLFFFRWSYSKGHMWDIIIILRP
jgi:hypothetical protein